VRNKKFFLIAIFFSTLSLTGCDNGSDQGAGNRPGGESDIPSQGGGGNNDDDASDNIPPAIDDIPGDEGNTDTPEEGDDNEVPGDEGNTDTPEEGDDNEVPGDEGNTDTPEEGDDNEVPGNEGNTDTPEEGDDNEVPGDEGNTDTPEEGDDNEVPGDEGASDEEDTPANDEKDICNEYINAVNAVKSRNASQSSEEELLDYTLCQVDSRLKKKASLRAEVADTLYNGLGDTYTWLPGGYSTVFTLGATDKSLSVLDSTNKESIRSLAVVGEQMGHRYAALSANPVDLVVNGTKNHIWMKNIVSWVTKKQSRTGESYRLVSAEEIKLNVVITGMPQRHYDGFKSWLESIYPDAYTLNGIDECNSDELLKCIKDKPVDILIVGDSDGVISYIDARDGIEYAIENKIPLVTTVTSFYVRDLLAGIYDYMGISAGMNYFDDYQAVNYKIDGILSPSSKDDLTVRSLIEKIQSNNFSANSITGTSECEGNMLNCNSPDFNESFRNGANILRNRLIDFDKKQMDVLSVADYFPVEAAVILLADKYREAIDYPVSAENEPEKFQRALFADWLVNYARPDNQPQPDLGEYATKPAEVTKGIDANYHEEAIISETKSISIPYPKQWTTSGWYIPAGKMVTISSSNDSASVILQPGFSFLNAQWTASTKTLLAPSEASHMQTSRLTLSPGQTLTFSSPYGGPLYIRFTDNNLKTANLKAEGVMKYPVIMDVNDANQLDEFEKLLEQSDVPHVDIRTEALEIHAMKYRLTDGVKNSSDGYKPRSIKELLKQINDFYTWNYTLGGYSIQGKTLSESLPSDVLRICTKLFGDDCVDTELHSRTIIQHINYDNRTKCVGYGGCSGNPFDTTWNIEPYAWGDNHELGHNLQTGKLNVSYAAPGEKERWTSYSSRATENSNNIFPYHTLWKISTATENTENTSHGDPLEVYAMVMSELRRYKNASGDPVIYDSTCKAYNVTDGVESNRYTAAWQSNDYAIYNTPREAFYFQMLLHADKQSLRHGYTLENGFNIFTLLYQHSRIYDKYSKNEADWNSHQSLLGFSLFPYSGDTTYDGGNVTKIPGNDFMLVSLSYITDSDWRPYFDMFGLNYTSLASKQVDQNGFTRTVKQELFVNQNNSRFMPNNLLSQDPDLVMVDLTNEMAEFPGKVWSCSVN
jgi:hypothetical protein